MPIDKKQYIRIISRYKTVLIIEDHFSIGGVADLIARLIAEENLNIRFYSIGIEDYGQSGDPKDLYLRYGLDQTSINKKLKELLNG